MTRPGTSFREASADLRPAALPLAHLSLELGHLYFEDFRGDQRRLAEHFRQVAPWAKAAEDVQAGLLPGRRPRISTCFLIDDYFGPTLAPEDILVPLLAAADEVGLRVDYIARESACADAEGTPLAELVLDRIVATPMPGTNGSRPPMKESGWLSNGERSPGGDAGEAMGSLRPWAPPSENGALRHSVFVDVQLRDEHRWSCAYLATIWQLLRLGLLRVDGRPVAQPRAWEGPFPDDWARLPAVMQLNPAAAPFSAYRTMSLLGGRFLPTEHAVRTVLSQIAVDRLVNEGIVARAAGEGLTLPLDVVDRLQYLFMA